MILSKRDEQRLKGVHPDLARIVRHAAVTTRRDFMVIEGLRTMERQLELVKLGKSRTRNSRHLSGHAVDLAPLAEDGEIPWNRWDYFHELADCMKNAAIFLGIPLEWGGDWVSFRDGPHYQLPRVGRYV